jgi:hypothetical protein
MRVLSALIPQKVGKGAKTLTVKLRTSVPSTLTVGSHHLKVGTKLTTVKIPLPAKPKVGLVRVGFKLAPRDKSVKGAVTGKISVVRT